MWVPGAWSARPAKRVELGCRRRMQEGGGKFLGTSSRLAPARASRPVSDEDGVDRWAGSLGEGFQEQAHRLGVGIGQGKRKAWSVPWPTGGEQIKALEALVGGARADASHADTNDGRSGPSGQSWPHPHTTTAAAGLDGLVRWRRALIRAPSSNAAARPPSFAGAGDRVFCRDRSRSLEQAAHAPDAVAHAVDLFGTRADVHHPPGAHPVPLRVGPTQDPGFQRRLLTGPQSRRAARLRPVVQPLQSFGVVAHYRIPQRLALHPGQPGGSARDNPPRALAIASSRIAARRSGSCRARRRRSATERSSRMASAGMAGSSHHPSYHTPPAPPPAKSVLRHLGMIPPMEMGQRPHHGRHRSSRSGTLARLSPARREGRAARHQALEPMSVFYHRQPDFNNVPQPDTGHRMASWLACCGAQAGRDYSDAWLSGGVGLAGSGGASR